MSEVRDIIYLGSGPINVIEASLNPDKNQLIIDSKNQIGGAWVAIEVGKFGNLEIGCHIWSYHKASYEFLRSFLELDLIKLSPQPYFLKGKSKLIYDHKNAIITIKQTGKKLIKGKFMAAFKYLKEDPEARFPIIPKPYLYPRGGAREFQEKLISKFNESNAEIALQTEITTIKHNGKLWECYDRDQNLFLSKKIILTATSTLRSIEFGSQKIDLEFSYINYTHLHFIIEGKPLKPFSYIRLLNHDFIHRLSDITTQLSEKEENCSVLLIGVFDDKFNELENLETAIELIREYLITNKFIEKDQQILYTQKNTFKTAYINQGQRKTINGLDDSIELYSTTDLIFGVESKLKDWLKTSS